VAHVGRFNQLYRRCAYSIRITRSLASMCWPGDTKISAIFPSRGAWSTVSIFMASNVAMTSPVARCFLSVDLTRRKVRVRCPAA
jgi:hypothetical protein